jgi:hypothetical protein
VSGATYRIEVKHMPAEGWWAAVIVRLSDEYPMEVRIRNTAELAASAAREWVAAQHKEQEPVSLYVGDDGQDAEAPHSVKV